MSDGNKEKEERGKIEATTIVQLVKALYFINLQ